MDHGTADFGFEKVAEADKAKKVGQVFDSVAPRYDMMNDLMSAGLHRLWKRFTIELSGVRVGARVLDVAAGSGDLTLAFARRVAPSGQVWMSDLNASLLAIRRARLLGAGVIDATVLADAAKRPVPAGHFVCVSVHF